MIRIPEEHLRTLVADAEKSFPDECCGFVFGREDDGHRQVEAVLVVDNAKEGDKRRRFEITPKDYLRAEHFADAGGLQLLGIYHSHPDHPAIPSEHDRIAAQPFFSYLILSVKAGRFDHIRSWVLNEARQFEEEKIHNT
jgi:proteasome lid subunit RPN8/RPN11